MRTMNREIIIQEGCHVIKLSNTSPQTAWYGRDTDCSFLQLHFCVKHRAQLHFERGYKLEIDDTRSVFLYNPTQKLPVHLGLEPGAVYVFLLISIQVFHSFFSREAGLIPFLKEENKDRKYYSDKIVTPSESVVLNQLFDEQIHPSLEELYTKAKVYELLSLYFNKKENTQPCPFLESKENVEKIKEAKNIIISRMNESPTLRELALEVALPLPKLKEGFKHIYGASVFDFLWDYKMEYARKLLLSKQYNVSEISLQIGYSTASHFIAAFRKKYGTTPKQYVMHSS